MGRARIGRIVLAAILTFAAFAGTTWAEEEAQTAEKLDALQFIPDEVASRADILLSVNYRTIVDVAGLQDMDRIIELACLQFQRSNFLREMSLSFATDISDIAAAIDVPDPALNQAPLPMMGAIITGHFNRDAIFKVIKREIPDVVEETDKDQTVLSLQGPDLALVLAIPDARYAVFGTPEFVLAALNAHAAGAQQTAAAKKMQNLQGTFRVSINKNILPPEAWDYIATIGVNREDVDSIGITSTVQTMQTIGADLKAQVKFKNQQGAAAMTNAIVMGLNTAQQMAPLTRLAVEKLDIETKNNTVTVSAEPMPYNNSAAPMLLAAGMLMPALSNARMKAKEAHNMSNLRQIGIGCIQYHVEYGDKKWPSSLKDLYDQKLITEPRVFVHPSDEFKGDGWQCSYDSIFDMTDKQLTGGMPSDLMIVWDNQPRNNTRCILFCDSHTEAVSEGQFQNYLQKTKEYVEQVK